MPSKLDKINDNNTTNGTAPPLSNGTSIKNGTSLTNGEQALTNGNHNNGHAINVEDTEIEEAKGKADIQIEGNLLKIARTGPVEWSDDEYEDDDDEEAAPPPPPPPPPPPVPPPPPPPPGNNFSLNVKSSSSFWLSQNSKQNSLNVLFWRQFPCFVLAEKLIARALF